MSTIIAEIQQHTLTLTLNRPDKANAFNRDMILNLRAALDEAAANDDVRAILLKGAGENFCSGQDITEMRAAEEINISYHEHLLETYNPLVLKLRQIEKPVIAAIKGSAAGAGLGVALACDLRLADENASFTVGFTGIGLVPDTGVSLLLPALIGLGRATEYTFSNLPISAQDALAWGLVNRLVPADALYPTATQITTMLALGPVKAFADTKKAFNRALLPNLEEALDYEGKLQDAAGKRNEHRIGVKAFLAKENPQFL